MSIANVFVAVTDPDGLLEGTDPVAPFEARYIQVFRYASEATARADDDGSDGTLLGTTYTFELVPRTTERSDPDIAGPFRYGYADPDQKADSWYRYRFGNEGLDTFSLLSDPWEADGRLGTTLRDLLFEAGRMVGGTVKKGTAGANENANEVVCAELFQSSLRDPRFYEGWYLLCSQADGAPEGESAQIAQVDTETGTVTLERSLSAAIDDGDTILISAALPFDDMTWAINRAREIMRVPVTVDIALAGKENRYPVPYGVKTPSDVIDVVGVRAYDNSNREDEWPLHFKVVFDGPYGWIEIQPEQLNHSNVARLTMLRSYRDMEGVMENLSDSTLAPIEWLRPAAAYSIARHLVEEDPQDTEAARLLEMLSAEAESAAGVYAPEVKRRANTGSGRRILPGPREW